ncbi:jg6605 [Pararge aegeria aegeria]|uniref:Jg6605 protein n=1 Tax=Pararge aegeria aegeria TaxID=348720 RepID=A0A8S4S274_9NEOP|nr:jg6605 [Pararge aegeria aegeria]
MGGAHGSEYRWTLVTQSTGYFFPVYAASAPKEVDRHRTVAEFLAGFFLVEFSFQISNGATTKRHTFDHFRGVVVSAPLLYTEVPALISKGDN